MVEENLHPCPLCTREAAVSIEPIEQGLPEELSQVECNHCGQYVIVTRLTRPDDSGNSQINHEQLDFEEIRHNNHAASVETLNLLWTDTHASRDEWDASLREQAHHLGGKAAYAVRVIPYKNS